MTQFVFSVANDTLNGAVSCSKLDYEIRSDTDIPVELEGVSTSGDVLTVDFQSDLDSAQETRLGVVVGAHDGVPPVKGPALATRSSDNCLRVVQEPSSATSLMQIVGFKIEPEAPADEQSAPKKTIHDIEVSAPLDIQGVHSIWFDNQSGHPDDYLDFTVVFPTGGTKTQWEGLGFPSWPFGEATAAPVDVELLNYGSNVYLPHDGQVIQVLADGSKTVAPPLVIRISYFAYEVSPSVPVVVRGNIRWWLLGADL